MLQCNHSGLPGASIHGNWEVKLSRITKQRLSSYAFIVEGDVLGLMGKILQTVIRFDPGKLMERSGC